MRPGQTEPNELELAVLDRIAQEHPTVRPMIKGLHVLSREYTGVGSFTNFKHQDSQGDSQGRWIGLNPLIRISSVPNGLGAMLFCEGSQITLLEIYTFGDDWDGLYDGFKIDDAPDEGL